VLAPDDAPRHQAGEVIARLEKTEAAIRNLSVTTEYVMLQRDDLPGSEPVRMRLTTAFIVDSTGRALRVHRRSGQRRP
jgi:hypothetical protein